jgi:hypothetical protein
LTLLCIPALLGAGPLTAEQRLINRVFHALSSSRSPYRIYFEGSQLPEILRNNDEVRLVSDPREAQIIVADRVSKKLERYHKPILVLRYELLKSYSQAIGAYFWQKGRPNIVMIRQRLRRVGIRLPSDFERYIETTLW